MGGVDRGGQRGGYIGPGQKGKRARARAGRKASAVGMWDAGAKASTHAKR
jgi:hypothetical protein